MAVREVSAGSLRDALVTAPVALRDVERALAAGEALTLPGQSLWAVR